jgi:Flp pilus assembly protein TadB
MALEAQNIGRVEQHTPDRINEDIQILAKSRVREFSDRLDAIEQRLNEIDREWDIERTLEANAATITLFGLVLSLRWKWFTMLPMVVAGFLLQHAVQGWCPPVAIFRRLGVRTMKEMDRERYALKALRGDFKQVDSNEDGPSRADEAYMAARIEGR